MAAYDRRSFSDTAVATTLASGINASVEAFTLAANTGWPTGSAGDFFALIESEVIRCDVRSSNAVTVLSGGRGACGTSATTHASGVAVYLVHVASFDDDEANYAVNETVGQITAAGQILVADAANSLAAVQAKTSGQILVGNGTTLASVAMSGDATLASTGALTIANGAITAAKIAGAVAGDGLVGGAGSALAVNPDGATLEIATDAVRIKDGGVSTAKIAAAAVDENKLASSVAGAGLLGGAGTVLSVNVDDSTITTIVDVVQLKDAGVTTSKLAAGLPRGKIGYTELTANSSNFGGSAGDISGFAVTVTVRAGSRIRITVECSVQATAAATVGLYIKEGATQLTVRTRDVATSNEDSRFMSVVLTPSTGSHTYKVQAAASVNTIMVASATQPAYILVEDIGA